MFVSRALYESVKRDVAVLISANEQLFSHLTSANARYDALLEKYHALKLAGAGEPAPAPKPLERTKASAVDEVIGTVSGTNSRLRKQLKDFAVAQRFAGADEQEIAHALLNWREDEDGVPE